MVEVGQLATTLAISPYELAVHPADGISTPGRAAVSWALSPSIRDVNFDRFPMFNSRFEFRKDRLRRKRLFQKLTGCRHFKNVTSPGNNESALRILMTDPSVDSVAVVIPFPWLEADSVV
jgi:hypothetical protein